MAAPHPDAAKIVAAASFTEELVAFATGDIARLTKTAGESAGLAIADCIGSALAGTADPASVIVRSAIEPHGAGSVVWGTGLRAPPREAALANGTAAHALAIDDTNESMKGHPSAPIVPALLALGERLDARGAALIEAYVVGIEVAGRIGRAMNPSHAERGWHSTVTLGTLGATAAAGRLLGLDAAKMRNALGIATTTASGLRINFGTMTKALGPGLAARNGLLAASLAGNGFTANGDALAGDGGFIELFGTASRDLPARDPDAPLEIERPGVVFKIYPCCSLAHAAIDLVLDAVDAGEVAPSDIEAVTVSISPRLDRTRVRERPASPLQAKFSIEFVIACALLRRAVGNAEFEPRVLEDPAVAAMMQRVTVRVGDGFDDGNPDRAHIDIRHRASARWSGAREKPRGHWSNPLPDGVLRSKFLNGAEAALGATRAGQAWQRLMSLEQAGCRELASLLAPPA